MEKIQELEKKIKYAYYEMQLTKSPMRKKDLKRHAQKLERELKNEKNVQLKQNQF